MKTQTVLFIHALGLDSHAFDPVRNALDPHWQVISHDLPGHGKSPSRRFDSFDELASDLASQIEQHSSHDAGVHVVGHAFGALVAAHLCQKALDVTTLTLIAAPVEAQPGFRERALMAERDLSSMVPQSLERWFGGLDDCGNIAWARHYGEQCLMALDAQTYARGWTLLADQPDFTALAGKLPPTLVLWAEDDRSTPTSLIGTIEAAFAGNGKAEDVRHVLLPRGGHMLPLVQPEAVAAAFQSFWSDASNRRIR